MREGASGYVLKESAGEELVTATSEVHTDRIYLTPAAAPLRRVAIQLTSGF